MPTVYHCSPTNSTFFTSCCHCAICDYQACCPQCGEEITPRDHRGRWRAARRLTLLEGNGAATDGGEEDND
jgi:hypothetical protein